MFISILMRIKKNEYINHYIILDQFNDIMNHIDIENEEYYK